MIKKVIPPPPVDKESKGFMVKIEVARKKKQVNDDGFREGFWLIVLNKTECPYNVHGCSYDGIDHGDCKKSNCPVRQSRKH